MALKTYNKENAILKSEAKHPVDELSKYENAPSFDAKQNELKKIENQNNFNSRMNEKYGGLKTSKEFGDAIQKVKNNIYAGMSDAENYKNESEAEQISENYTDELNWLHDKFNKLSENEWNNQLNYTRQNNLENATKKPQATIDRINQITPEELQEHYDVSSDRYKDENGIRPHGYLSSVAWDYLVDDLGLEEGTEAYEAAKKKYSDWLASRMFGK